MGKRAILPEAAGGRLHIVGSLLKRLFGGGRAGRPPVTCYLRENGPIAYELDLFATSPRDRADAMMESPLAWAWTSGAREWTELTRISLSAFLADVPSGVRLVAIEGDLPTELSEEVIAGWIRRFCRTQPSPLAAVIDVTVERQLLFVQQHASEPVNRLLEDWGIDKGAAARKAYARLGPASLEAIAERR
jgi:hypothetical protein